MNTLVGAAGLFAFWYTLVESTDPTILIMGLVLSLVISHLAIKYLWPADAPPLKVREVLRFVAYMPHLIRCMVASAIQVAEVVLDPKMPIEPVIVTHRTSLARDASRVAYANSITLTPGTLTVDVEGSTFHIHCLHERFSTDIASGDLEQRIANVFEE